MMKNPLLLFFRIKKSLDYIYRYFTSPLRKSLPDFIIIGAQRCGTTSLYNYLINQPTIVPAFLKELHFFDNNYNKGLHWYKRQFPTN
ncbi:MAG: hypothetical protein GF329_05560, partial [Candidatus Lokiarchaeota archaeon]|nr:hypothetical protein [Candidatus Lokiarchaeota archaeon]